MLFGAVAIGGWSMLRAGQRLRRGGSPARRCSSPTARSRPRRRSTSTSCATSSPSATTHVALRQVPTRPPVRRRPARAAARCRCPTTSSSPTPAGSSAPGPGEVVARSQARPTPKGEAGAQAPHRARRRRLSARRRGVHEAIVDVNDDPLDQVPPAGFTRVSRAAITRPMSAADPPGAVTGRPTRRAEAAAHAPAAPIRRRAPQPDARARAARARAPAATAAPAALAMLLAVCSSSRSACACGESTHGLPYAYNIDENTHFVPRAMAMFGHTLNPRLLRQPAGGHVRVLDSCSAVWFGGREHGSTRTAAIPPRSTLLARVTVAVLGTISVWLLYLTGRGCSTPRRSARRRRARRSPSCPSSTRTSRSTTCPRWRRSRSRCWAAPACCAAGGRCDYLVAGVGLGLACATKYTAGIVALPLIGAARCTRPARRSRHAAGRPGPARAVGAGARPSSPRARLCFVLANPYSLLDFPAFPRRARPPVRR